MRHLEQYLASAVDLILPERCPSCGAITRSAQGGFCADCWQRLHFLAPPWCAGCALPFGHDQGDRALCANCLDKPPLHDGVRAAVAYDEISRKVALRLKYGGKIGLARMIAAQLVRHLPEDHSNVLVTPVPLHRTRLWQRTFNQSALIARALCDLSSVQYAPDILVRNRSTPSLKGLSGKERERTVRNAFAIHPRWQECVKGAQILLVDDVLTSGATSNACIRMLKKGGAEWVQLFCWARVLPGEAMPDRSMVGLDVALD